MLVLLLHYASPNDGTMLYFRSDKGNPTVVYDIKVIKQILGSEICQSLLFFHAFTSCDTTSRIFGIGKQSALQKLIKGDPVLQSCVRIFSTWTPGQDMDVIVYSGCAVIVSLFNSKPGHNQSVVRYNRLCKNVNADKSLVTPERLSPTSSATKYHSLRSYIQVMQWMGKDEDIDFTKWGSESTNQQTSSSDAIHCTRTTNTPENASLQLLRCLQYTPLYLLRAWTGLFSSM